MAFKVAGCARISAETSCIKCKETSFARARISCTVTSIFGTTLRAKCSGDVGGKVILLESPITSASVNMIDEPSRSSSSLQYPVSSVNSSSVNVASTQDPAVNSFKVPDCRVFKRTIRSGAWRSLSERQGSCTVQVSVRKFADTRVKDKGDIDGADVVVDAVNTGIACLTPCKTLVPAMMYGALNSTSPFPMSNSDFTEPWAYMASILTAAPDSLDI